MCGSAAMRTLGAAGCTEPAQSTLHMSSSRGQGYGGLHVAGNPPLPKTSQTFRKRPPASARLHAELFKPELGLQNRLPRLPAG